MTDPRAPEPPFEILMVSPENGTTAPAPPAPAPETPSPARSPIKETWFTVTHFLVLFALAGVVVWVLGLTWQGRPFREGARARAVPASSALAVVDRFPLPGAPSPARPPEKPEPPPQGQEAEGSHLEGSRPPGLPSGLPPAPGSSPVVVEPEAAPAKSPAVASAPLIPEPALPPGEPEEGLVPAEIRLEPDVLQAKKWLEDARGLETENPQMAALLYRKAIPILPGRVDLWKTVADLDLGRGAFSSAEQAYRELLRFEPDRADAHQNLAILHMRAGRFEEAQKCLEAAIKSVPSADLHYNLGNLHLKTGRLDAAVFSYRRALEYDPRHGEARFNLALALERLGKRAEAVAVLAQLPTVSPEVARERARMEAMLGGLEGERALSAARVSSDINLILAAASGFRRAGEFEKALALLDHAVELAPRQAGVLLNRGGIRQTMGLLSEAEADYLEASKLDPQLAEAPFNLGVLAEERGRYVAALGHYSAALKANPKMASALNNVGALYHKVGQSDRALQCFQRSREIDPSFPGTRLNLAWAHLATGTRDRAIEELKIYLKEIPKDQQDPEALRVLKELEAPRIATGSRP